MYLCEHTNQVNLLQAGYAVVAGEYGLPWHLHRTLRMGLISPAPGKQITFRRYNFNCAS